MDLTAVNEQYARDIAATECPVCGTEPDVQRYFRRTGTGERCGYHCGCGAIVVDGMYQGMNLHRWPA
ncbi:hypothetical protein [Actinomadura opuntiae]|uniref:hypothetical protein n=1 Tax=Actinomadura sp. OS1-43 TaxID=604315 RepID=UPI00255B2FF9|nr:hypothetical protein [Actinomadura sp. OS1-43]MDL4812796.1 hypothetical protein [Actinomadura sp. OS1-43]